MAELDRLFNPRSVAVIGASRDRRKSGSTFVAGLVKGRYRGSVYPVNPREAEIMGLTAYADVAAIPGEIDLAVVAVPASAVLDVIGDCARKGVRFAIVHTAGFAELGEEGRELQRRVVEAAGDTRIVGPNCMGVYSPGAGINMVTGASVVPEDAGGVAFVGQSGWATENVTIMGYERGLRFSKAVSIGNQSDLSHEDFLRYFGADDATSVIGFYVEGFKRGDEFLRLAREISRWKPIVVWETGRTEGGARVTMSHTGSAGDALISYDALGASGVATAVGLEELVDLLVGFSGPVMPRGNRVGLLVEAGGAAAAAADAASELGIAIPALSEQAQREMARILATQMVPFATPKNPVDTVWTPVNYRAFFERCLRVMLSEMDSLVVVNYVGYDDEFASMMAGVRDEMGKPILFVPGHPTERREGMSILTRHGLPAFGMPERAFRALAAMLRRPEHQPER